MDGSYFKKIADDVNITKRFERQQALEKKFNSIIAAMTTAAEKGLYYVEVAVSYKDYKDFLELIADKHFKIYHDWNEITAQDMHEFYQSPEHTITVIISWQHIPTQ